MANEQEKDRKLTVKLYLQGGKKMQYVMTPHQNLKKMMTLFAEHTGFSANILRYYYKERLLKEEETLASVGIPNNGKILVSISKCLFFVFIACDI